MTRAAVARCVKWRSFVPPRIGGEKPCRRSGRCAGTGGIRPTRSCNPWESSASPAAVALAHVVRPRSTMGLGNCAHRVKFFAKPQAEELAGRSLATWNPGSPGRATPHASSSGKPEVFPIRRPQSCPADFDLWVGVDCSSLLVHRTFPHEPEGGNAAERLRQKAALDSTQEISLRCVACAPGWILAVSGGFIYTQPFPCCH